MRKALEDTALTASGSGVTANGDATYNVNIADNAGIALFRTANPVNFNLATRLDAVGANGDISCAAESRQQH